ncbi:MAG: DEAD/DEAH box helicase, partial [Proteobacteria bacterium]|nr:DEAD/DEAH box helicase [Pseudomonadota bacterium]
MEQMLETWQRLDPRRRIILVGAAVLTLVAVLSLAQVATRPGMALLYSGLDPAAAGEVIGALEAMNVESEVRGNAVYVAEDERDRVRLALARDGLPRQGQAGYELLDQLSGFSTTTDMFNAAYWRAKEGELARTILATAGVRAVRVHIATPSRRPFARDAAGASASVTVTMAGGVLTQAQATAIRYLVALAVAELRPTRVAVIDSRAGMILAPGADTPMASAAGEAAEREVRLKAEIERAGGREVCFLARVDEDRVVREPRAVARGNFAAVLVAARDADEGGVMLHNHPSGVLEPSDADMRVAAQLYEEGLGTAIIDNGAEQLYVVVEPPQPRVRVPLKIEELDALLAPDGALAERFDGYEDRPGQRDMLRTVVDRFNEGGVAIVEAGTGTGKSLAYLLPAARWAQENGERTVISTNTINLQEQLAGKDLPLVQSLIGEVRWALVKGRGNYVSIRRALLAAEAQTSLFDDDRSDEMRALLEWISTTDDGSLSDLPFTPEPETWEEVRSDPDICLRSRCPHFQQCFYQRSRRRAASAELLVVNHHLLFTDLAVRNATLNFTQSAVLPAYNRVILDEAHNIEDAATSHLGVEVTRRSLYRMFSRLDRRGKGILTALHGALSGSSNSQELRERLENRVRPAMSRARAEVEGFVETIESFIPPGGGSVRLGPSGIGEPAERDDVRERLAGTLASMGALEREVAELRARIELDEEISDALEGRVLDLRSVERRLAASMHGLRLVLAPGEEADTYVRWLEARGRGKRANVVMAAAPIDLGGL